jgi:two-component system sensor histidine kinase RpfC
MADLLMESCAERTQRSAARTIQTSARTLLETIEGILDFSKIEAGRIVIETIDFDLHQLMNEIVRMSKPQAEQKNLALVHHLHPSVPYRLRGDPFHLRQVLLNLLSNAVKFTDHGSVQLRVQVAQEPAADGRVRIRFEVEDTGIGIAAQAQERIFESFQQANSNTSRLYGGTGLGTAIARDLTQLMGGRIGLRSELGRGTLFWIELPFGQQSAVGEESEDKGLAAARVLLVGGRKGDLDAKLSEWCVESSHVDSPSAALAELHLQQKAQRASFCVLLVDGEDPRIDPEQVVNAVRSRPALADVKLVLVRSSSHVGIEEALLQFGYFTVLSRPLDRRQFLNTIHAACSAQEPLDNVISISDRYQAIAGHAKRKLEILIAEDNETNRRVLHSILERAGHVVTQFADGESALDALTDPDGRFDLMILDKNMPGRTGLEVFKAYGFVAQHPVPCILLTADATAEAIAECADAKVDAYLTKPLNPDLLLETIARLSGPGREEPGIAGRSSRNIAPEPERLVDQEKVESLRKLGQGPAFFGDLVASFHRDGERMLARIREALSASDYPLLHEAIHALRGSAGEIGAVQVAEICARIRELEMSELNSKAARELSDRLAECLNATIDRLGQMAAGG